MSDKSKNLVIPEISFDDLSGGTETKTPGGLSMPSEVVVPAVPSTVEPAAPVEVKPSPGSGYFIPLDDGKGAWTLTPIEEVTGEQFLGWAANVYPQFRTQRLNPEAFDTTNPKSVNNKKHIVNVIAKYYQDTFIRTRRMNTEEVAQ